MDFRCPWKLLLTGMLAPAPEDRSVSLDVSIDARDTGLPLPLGSIDPCRATSRQSVGDPGIYGADRTAKLPLGLRAPRQWRQERRRNRRTNVRNARVIAILVLVVILGGIGIAFALGSKNPSGHDDHSRADDDRSSFDDHDLASRFRTL